MDLSATTVRQSVKTLLCLPRSNKKSIELVPTDERIELTIAVKKIPMLSKAHVGKFLLPHSMYNADSNVCLFVKDEGSKKDRDFDVIKEKYLKQLKEQGIKEVKEVMPLKQLKLEFEPFEAKRRLSDAFDGFIADERIFHFLRSLLGKHFHERHRFPVPARFRNDVGRAVKTALRTRHLTINKRGPCSMLTVGMINVNTEDEIVENILSAWKQMDTQLPGGLKNVRSITIKTAHSKSVPVYQDLDYETPLPIPDLRVYHEEPEAEEIDTVAGAKVMVYPDGRVRLVRKAKKEPSEGGSNVSSDEDEDDRLVKKLIDQDEETEARRKRRLERRAKRAGKASKAKKPRRPLLEAHAKATKAEKAEKAEKH